MGHNWHVHQQRRGAGSMCSEENVGSHYDPFLVKTAMNAEYDMECEPNAQLRCEMGDLSGKHGQMRIEGGSVSSRMTSVEYDVNLHLAGPYTGEKTEVYRLVFLILSFHYWLLLYLVFHIPLSAEHVTQNRWVPISSPPLSFFLPPPSVLGRSIVIHSHIDGSYLTCANIDPAILSEVAVNITFPLGDNETDDLNFR